MELELGLEAQQLDPEMKPSFVSKDKAGICLCNSFFSTDAEGLSLITEHLMQSILIFSFSSAELRSSQYLLFCWCSHCHDTML